MKSKAMTQKKMIIRILTAPFRALYKAKELYIRSITDCANHTTYGTPAIPASVQFPRSYSASSFGSEDSATDDLRELVRANSTAGMGDLNLNKAADLDLYIRQQLVRMKQSSPAMGSSRKVPRSVSLGMGRIDEDAPVASFPGDKKDISRKVKSENSIFPRSKSHASTKINRYAPR